MIHAAVEHKRKDGDRPDRVPDLIESRIHCRIRSLGPDMEL